MRDILTDAVVAVAFWALFFGLALVLVPGAGR